MTHPWLNEFYSDEQKREAAISFLQSAEDTARQMREYGIGQPVRHAEAMQAARLFLGTFAEAQG